MPHANELTAFATNTARGQLADLKIRDSCHVPRALPTP